MRKERTEGVVQIGSLFDIYKKKLKAPQKTVIKTFQEVVKDLLQITFKNDQCSYTVFTKTLSITVSGTIKTEILLRKKEILTHMRGRLGEKSAPKDII